MEDGTDSPQRGLGRLPEVALGMACATLIVAAAFAGARSSKSWATDLFWVGQVALYAIPAAFLLVPPLDSPGRGIWDRPLDARSRPS